MTTLSRLGGDLKLTRLSLFHRPTQDPVFLKHVMEGLNWALNRD